MRLLRSASGESAVIIERRETPEPASRAPAISTRGKLDLRLPLRWRWRLSLAVAVAAYYLLWALTAFDKVNPTDLDIFFLPATHIALTGRPLDVYTLRLGTIYPNANGPLSLLPLTLAAWLAQARGWLGDPMLRRMLVFAVCAPFPLLVGWEGVRAVDRFGPPLRGVSRALLALPLVLSPLLWLDALYYGHIEQTIVVWLALASTRMLADTRYVRGGALLGLALLARSDATLIVLALGLTLLVWRRWRGALLTLLATGATVALGLAPFLLADGRDVIFSLFTFRGALPVGGGDFWSVSDAATFVAIAQRFDALFTLLFAALLVLLAHIVRSDLDLNMPDVYGLLTVASLCFALLIKTLWPYYFLESALFATVWALASMPHTSDGQPPISRDAWGGWMALWLAPLTITACALVSEYGLEANNYNGWVAPWIQTNIVCEVVTLAVCVALLFGGRWARWMVARRSQQAPGGILTESASGAAIDG
ncbi:MAG TPA: hypothetical protein VE338_12230 [Ktedonobacterales bacterium]|nr:hypothetical protein [Ktedonobacterales bacterium]